MTDRVRSERARLNHETAAAAERSPFVIPSFDLDADPHDDTLVLLFMCCHPALTPASAIALTLRAVGGLTTAEIASAFLVPEASMAQRITRAKATIKSSGVRFQSPSSKERAERLRAVLHVLYLIFSEGYTSSAGPELARTDLSAEAIRLTRATHALLTRAPQARLPEDTEVAGLLALMLLTDARRTARTGPAGELIPLNEQDRSLWDQRAIAEGIALLTGALQKGSIGSYTLQAAIAAVHDEAPRAAQTDWPQILALYELLRRMSDNPMVLLNHAVAAAMVHGPAAGLDLLNALDTDDRLASHHRLHAVRAHLFELAGDRDRALEHYRAAAKKTASIPERNYLLRQAARLAEGEPLRRTQSPAG
jgi:predicted RNA polymerase sigma factor